jgi:predicted HAD superfamily hydrolase
MLRKCGFDPVHLFISSSVGLSKETGRLFTHALDALGISDPKSVLHIGDNENADVAAPHKLGINTLHFRHLHEVDLELTSITGYKPQDECDFISALIFGLSRRRIIGRGAASTTHNLIDVGYYSFGPVFAGWLLWLTRRVSELSPDRILLFARDTQLIDRLVDEGLVSFGDAAVTYVYVSRFSLCFAGIRTLDDFSLEILLGRFKEYNFGKFLDLWMEHAPEEKSSLIIPKKLNSNTPINDFWHWTLRDFIRANSLTLLAASVKHRQHVMRHLGRDLTDGRTVLIDIGWHGNMQAAWLNAVGGKIDIKNVEGLYFGLFPDAQKNMKLGHHMEGWLTSPQEISAWTRALWSGGVELLELALSAEHGTTLGYTKEEATPILAAPNNDGDYITACRTLQMGMVEFWKDLTEFLANGEASHISTQPSEWSAPFYRLICRPMLHEVELLGDIRHRFSGGMVAKATPLAPRSPWHKRIIPRLRQSEEKAAFWKAGYVKRNRRF